MPVTAKLLARGQQRFNINCSPCHGAQADGNGITQETRALATVANLHDKRIVELADGEIFNTITYGKNMMGAYGANVTVEDRWAIIAYLRALQLSQLGTVDDVPEPVRGPLEEIAMSSHTNSSTTPAPLDLSKWRNAADLADRHRRRRRGDRASFARSQAIRAFPGCWRSCSS